MADQGALPRRRQRNRFKRIAIIQLPRTTSGGFEQALIEKLDEFKDDTFDYIIWKSGSFNIRYIDTDADTQ